MERIFKISRRGKALYLGLSVILAIPVALCVHTYLTLPPEDPERFWWDTIGLFLILFLSMKREGNILEKK
jgi:hypothetical protein